MKTKLGAVNCLYPLPAVLAGANLDGRPNFIAMAHVGIMDLGSVSMGMSKTHYTNAGIKANKTFSINIPSVALVKETDYWGIVSGRDADKARLFDVFYGTLKTAPMIRQCPACMEFGSGNAVPRRPRNRVAMERASQSYARRFRLGRLASHCNGTSGLLEAQARRHIAAS
jgi:hypothetical protein